MNDQASERPEGVRLVTRNLRGEYAVLGAVCALVIGVYAWIVKPGMQESSGLDPVNSYYNLLVQGFRAGQLNLKKEVPPGLAQLANPYDPDANAPYRLHDTLLDLSYYRGNLYLYFGATPALVLFWPYHELTGHYLRHQDAVLIFCSLGFLAGAGLLLTLWRQCFVEASVGAVAAGILAMGLASGTPLLLARADVCEVPISCGFALTMLALLLIWRVLHSSGGRVWWLAGASVSYGLAVGARPSLLFGAAILLVPTVLAWRKATEAGQPRRVWVLLLGAVGPMALIGLGVMLYNRLRFDNPFVFGWRQQLGVYRQDVGQAFSLEYLWSNFRIYFLEPERWSIRFPFVHGIGAVSLPANYAVVEDAFGVLLNLPVVWLGLAAPLAWRGRFGDTRSALQCLGVGLVMLSGVCALTLCLFWAAIARYEVEFLSPLVLLAVLGIFGLERAASGQMVWQRLVRCCWVVLLGCSATFILFARYGFYSDTSCDLGLDAFQQGRVAEAMAHFQKALALQPANVRALNSLGAALFQQGKVSEAIERYEESVRLKPDCAEAHYNLGTALLQLGRVPEALGHLEEGVRLKPGLAEAQDGLATALVELGRVPEALAHYEQALRIQPQHADANYNLGNLLVRLGRGAEAIPHYEQALATKPDQAGAHKNLAVALFGLGRVAEAVGQLEQALRLKPEDGDAHYNLGVALAQQGRLREAVEHYQQALLLSPGDAGVRNKLAWLLATCGEASVRNGARAIELAEQANQLVKGKDAGILDTLAAAYAEAGRFDEAVRAARTAIELAKQAGLAELAPRIQDRLRLYQADRPYHEATARDP